MTIQNWGNDPLTPIRFASSHTQFAPALILDFDGTIRQSKSGQKFIQGATDIELIDSLDSADTEKLLWEYRFDGWLICGVTNQGGVAYGHKTPDGDLAELRATLALFNNNPFHLVKTCWFMPGGKVPPYNTKSLLRKPFYGALALIEVEALERGVMINWSESLFVGDGDEDLACARAAGIEYMDAMQFFGRSVL